MRTSVGEEATRGELGQTGRKSTRGGQEGESSLTFNSNRLLSDLSLLLLLLDPLVNALRAKHRRILDRLHEDLVVGPHKIEHSDPIVLDLILGRNDDAVDARFEVRAREDLQSVGDVDGWWRWRGSAVTP